MLEAPWSAKQCEKLNARQLDMTLHAYTCPNCRGTRKLVAKTTGWACPECMYTQSWCHAVDAGEMGGNGWKNGCHKVIKRLENIYLNKLKAHLNKKVGGPWMPIINNWKCEICGKTVTRNGYPTESDHATNCSSFNGNESIDYKIETIIDRIVEVLE